MEGNILLAQTYIPTTIIGGQPPPQAGQQVPATTTAEVGVPVAPPVAEQAQPQGLFGAIGWQWIIIYVVIFGGYIWFIMRNNRKKQKKMADMRESLKVGDDVYTTGGLFGKIVDIEENAFVVEFGSNRGVRIPVLKSEVAIASGSEPVQIQK